MNIIEKLGFSPSPWKHINSMGDDYVEDAENDSVAYASVVYPECAVSLMETDAKLIASAPEMLEALIALVIRTEVDYELSGIELWDERIIDEYGHIIKLIENSTGKKWKEIKELLK